MDYEVEKPKVEREPMRPIYLWVPSIVSVLVIVLTLLMKVTEKTPNGFTSWGWVITVWVLTLIVTFGISIAVWLFLSIKDQKPLERQFNSREKCDHLLRQEIRRRTGYNLADFTETGDSIEGVGWFGAGTKQTDQDLIYYHLYRIKKGQLNRYLLGVMCTEQGKEDMVVITQSPMNFTDLKQLIEDTCNRLCRNPLRTVTRQSIYRDEVSGRSRVESEKSPFDVPENQEESLEEKQ